MGSRHNVQVYPSPWNGPTASMNEFVRSAPVMGVLALEMAIGTHPAEPALGQEAAGRLAELVARDLGALVPGVQELDLAVAAAHFDPAEVLRPGWPLHRRLDELRARAPGRHEGPRVLVFGADSSGNVPLPFQATPDLQGGSLRVLPYLLTGDESVEQDISERMEALLLETGMAGAETALLAQEMFGVRIEHARYMTVHDLAAMTAMQYSHQGLEVLWPLLEAALVAPESEAWVDELPEPLACYCNGEARLAMFEPSGWHKRYAPSVPQGQESGVEHLYRLFEARQRQFASVLDAHGIPVVHVFCPAGEDPRSYLL